MSGYPPMAESSFDEIPAIPSKNAGARVVTPSPGTYDMPSPQRPPSTGGYDPNRPPSTGGYDPNRPPSTGGYDPNRPPSTGGYDPRRPPSQHSYHSDQSNSIPGTPTPGFGAIEAFPNPRGSRTSSRASTPTSIQPTIQPYPGMSGISYGDKAEPQPQGIPPPASMQMKKKAPIRKPKPQGMQLLIASWIFLSVGSIFLNPVFGFIALGFSIVSLISDTNRGVVKFGQLAKYTAIVGIGLAIVLGVVTGVIFFTNNKGW